MTFIILTALFAQLGGPLPYETRVFINRESDFIIYARFYNGQLIALDSVVPLSEYLDRRRDLRNRSFLLEELRKDWLQKGGTYASKGLIGTFEIPLPKGGFSEFMGESGKLDVGGYVKITLGGSRTYVMTPTPTTQTNQSLWPELEMKQEMAINLDGQVGDRIKVFIDHNSERVDESENKITITYKGREDEILQEIEGGDTQLAIPATTYTGDIPSHRGLFGIKSSAKLGPLDVVGIASREQSQTQELVIEGSVQADTGKIWDKDYEKRRIFWLGTYDTLVQGSLEIYIDNDNGQDNQDNLTWFGYGFVDANDDNIPDLPGDTAKGYYTYKVPGDYYQFLPGSNTIRLNSSLYLNHDVLGVIYQKKFGDSIVTVGHSADTLGDTIQLKLICPRNEVTPPSPLWYYELRNYYQVVAAGSRLDSLRIYRRKPSGEVTDIDDDNIPFIQKMGLDSFPQDGVIDEYRVYDPAQGLLIFPEAMPFISSRLPEPDSDVYTQPYNYLGNPKYYLFKKTVEAKPVYNIPENAQRVWVWVDDIPQDSLSDYHVDYSEGTLEFKKPIAPTSRVRIKVEYTPLFSMAQKSLVGIRASMKTLGDGTLGSSFFYRTESYLADHVRLKEEPFSRMVWEADFAMPESLPFLTSVIDWLPLIETEAQSRLNINFEGAYSFSNLNSQGTTYLDDLETSTIISNEIQINRTSWIQSSMPVGENADRFARNRLVWYNPPDSLRLQADDIYTDPPDPNDDADVLKIIYQPDSAGSFAGLTQYLYGEDFSECENLEFIVRGSGGRVHFDVSQEISEDQLRRNRSGQLLPTGQLEDEDRTSPRETWTQESEDTGLDGVFGADGSNIAGDDGNDNYAAGDLNAGINGTEYNSIWDTEDIDRNGVLNTENRFYSYSLDLDSALFRIDNAGLRTGWSMFHIPIQDTSARDTMVGTSPDWRNIKYLRIWLDGFTQCETLLVYKVNFIGSRWKNYGIAGDSATLDNSEKFTLTPINTKNNAYYKPPYELEKDMFGNVKTEGALEFSLDSVRTDHYCIARRRTEESEDYRGYDTLSFYLRALSAASNPVIAIRLGADSLNFYEYRSIYDQAGELGYNDYRLYRIPLQSFLSLKNRKREASGGAILLDTLTEGAYTVAGNPSLSSNQFFEVRIGNADQSGMLLTDKLWFNDIRLTGPRNEVGRIIRGSASLNLADLSTINFSFNESNGRFRRLSEGKEISSQSAGRYYSLGGSLSLDKFLPRSWYFSIPLSVNYNNSAYNPRFWYNASDLEVDPGDEEKLRETSQSQSYTIQLSKSNSRNWFLKQTLDRLSLNHDRSYSNNLNPTACDTSRTQNYSASYSLDPKARVKVLNQTFTLLPTIGVSSGYASNEVRSYTRTDISKSFQRSQFARHKSLSPSYNLTYSPHAVLNTGFSFSEIRDSLNHHYGTFGEEVSRNQTMNASFQKNILILSPVLTYNAGYTEDHRFEIRQDNDYRNVTNTSRYGVSGGVDIKKAVKFLTGLRDEKKDSLIQSGSPMWIIKGIEKVIDYLQNPSLSYSRQRGSSYLQVMERPDPKYQFGLIDSLPKSLYAPTSYPGRSVTDNYGINSGFSYHIVSLSGSYSSQVSQSLLNSGQISKNVSQSYPNASLHISRLEALPLLKKYTHSSSINTSFNQDFARSYTVNGANPPELQSDSRTLSLSPLASWQANWVKGISTTADVTYSETKTKLYLAGTEVENRTLNRGGSLTAGYSFSAPNGLKLPFLHGVKLASTMSMNVNVNFSRATTYGPDQQPTADNTTLGSSLGLSYNFSASITGGATFDYAENKDRNSNTGTKRVGVNIWANINF